MRRRTASRVCSSWWSGSLDLTCEPGGRGSCRAADAESFASPASPSHHTSLFSGRSIQRRRACSGLPLLRGELPSEYDAHSSSFPQRSTRDLDGQTVGRWGEEIYRRAIDAGLRIPPLAGGGSESENTPVGYNRLYVGEPLEDDDGAVEAGPVTTSQAWWAAAWNGHSVATNGPLLRPKLAGKIPGHVFKARTGESLQLQPELTLAVRDPVEYLEVIKNGQVFYSARLDEFAKAGGIMPLMEVDESSWVMMRVVTLHEDHYRAAVSAPWYIDFDGRPRVGKKSVEFFQAWLSEYEERLKKLPPAELQRHVPFVKSARAFWAAKAETAVP